MPWRCESPDPCASGRSSFHDVRGETARETQRAGERDEISFRKHLCTGRKQRRSEALERTEQ